MLLSRVLVTVHVMILSEDKHGSTAVYQVEDQFLSVISGYI